MTPTRTGRRPGAPGTRDEILAAARQEFGARGFRATTLRVIAESAGVDVALIAHYFGNKEQLFAATVEIPGELRDLLVEAVASTTPDSGERLTRAYLGAWEDPAVRSRLLALVRSALSEGAALTRLRATFEAVMQPASESPQRHLGTALAISTLLGVAVSRHVTGVPPVAEASLDELVALVGPQVQAHLDAGR